MLFNFLRILFMPPKRRRKPKKFEVMLSWAFVLLVMALMS